LTSMAMFDGKKGDTLGDKYSSGLPIVKLLTDTLVTSRHIASWDIQWFVLIDIGDQLHRTTRDELASSTVCTSELH